MSKSDCATPTPPLSPDSTGPAASEKPGWFDPADDDRDDVIALLKDTNAWQAKRINELLAALTPPAPIAAPVRDDGAREAPEACLNISRRKLARITRAWEAKANLDDGDICFLIRMAEQRLEASAPVQDDVAREDEEARINPQWPEVMRMLRSVGASGKQAKIFPDEAILILSVVEVSNRVRKALEFYAYEAWEYDCDASLIGPGVWDGGSISCDPSEALRDDKGGRAKAALASLPAPAGDVPGEAQTRDGWRPIDTAPKGGTFVLTTILHGPWRPMVAHFASYEGVTRWGADPECFMEEEHFTQYWTEAHYEPTHWMPLPGEAQTQEGGR